ncbi:MAG: ribosome biogenesis GTP-binding protein YihA/YsxC [Myxococcaceae bacterium]
MVDLRFEKARYILSAPSVDILPVSDLPEFAFIGRSNVGKSSLLNYLANQKDLARVSKTPGRTQALNLFEAELEKKPLWILDLPGLGYAKLSLTERERLSILLSDYLERREQLTCLVHLLDCRRDPNPDDLDLSRQFRTHVPHYFVVMTKIDQIPFSKRKEAQKRFIKILEIAPEQCLAASASENLGREVILTSLSKTLYLS